MKGPEFFWSKLVKSSGQLFYERFISGKLQNYQKMAKLAIKNNFDLRKRQWKNS